MLSTFLLTFSSSQVTQSNGYHELLQKHKLHEGEAWA
jgi:hypothetical protein